MRTTFDLIQKRSKLSSKKLDDELNEIRKNFTPSLGKDHGRVVLKSAKPRLIERIQEFKRKLGTHQQNVEKELQHELDQSRRQIVDYYLPLAIKNPPDAMLGQLMREVPTEADAQSWLEAELEGVFPRAKTLITKMQLNERYKDVTFETLNQKQFLASVKAAFPKVDWDKAYADFRAVGEAEQ